ncbi:T9SS type B sorting domain-containing protein [Maribacter cobaltidurans]|nr:T9SS type B sorting domain-containing protein [Maribacter cobaltidurans]
MRDLFLRLSLFLIFLTMGTYTLFSQEYVPFTPRLDGGNIEVRGDIIFVGNNILNRASESNPAQANDPYNGTENNNSLWMEYIDIDSDPSTFSSSSAELNLTDPDCSQIRYAGLYWAGTYPNERSTDGGAQFNGTPRIEEWNEIKFQIPGGAYVDLVADNNPDPVGEEDDIILDGYQPGNPGVFVKDAPVICYKNITNLVRSNANPNGSYTAANIRATRGRRDGSSSAGWVMVIIYENPNESGKFISTFDGYASLSGSVGNVDVDVNGFRTLPAPFPVRARVGVGALEGDRGINNDRFFIRADLNSSSAFTNLSTGFNPDNNFFNSTITTNGVQVPTRTPYGTNTLGTDLDIFNLNNPSETVLPNDETGATLRFTSTGDGYGPFLASFSVEIIEPNIVLEKRVEDIAGNDITGQGVNLGQTLDYVLSFRNLGNDDAVGYTIRDVLPVNTTFLSVDLDGAPGVTHSFDSATNEITFNVPDNLVTMGSAVYNIRLRVRVAENCFDFVDACTDLIQNLAYSTYRGDINSAVISDDPSVSDFDNCGFVTPGATNFLLDDLSACNFSRTAQLCGDNVVLDSGDGFDNYVWYLDVNQDGLIDAGDVNITGQDGNPDNDPSTILVSEVGVYIVDKQVADPCKGFMEIITVERFGSTQTNPIIDFFNNSNADADPTNDIQGEIVADCGDGTTLFPKIFLCGINDTQLLQVNISDAQNLFWERLDESSCTVQPENCLNRNLGCSWDQVGTGGSFTATTAGKYRLSITYQNGCVSRFYFDIFQNTLDIQYNTTNVVCDTDGNITITNLGSGYGYQLVNASTDAVVIPFSANNGPSFDFTSNGAYRVEVVQLDPSTGNPILGACIFSTPDIGILDRDLQVDVFQTDANCNNLGSIHINANNVLPNYQYELRLDDGTPPPATPAYPGHPGGTLVDSETAQPSNTHTFNNVNPGNYFIITRTDDGCVDVQSVTVGRIPDPTLSGVTIADIGCTAGSIELSRTGGQGNPDFLFAIWSKDGTILHSPGGSPTEREIVDNIDPNAYQVETTFTFGWRDEDDDGNDEYYPGENGTYQFIVLDANNCYAISSPITINDNGSSTIDSIDEVQPSCSGDSDGELTINISGGIGPYQYSIDNGASFQPTNTFVGLSAGNYDIRVLDSSGCDISQQYVLNQPFPLSASAGVSRDATCDPNGAEVRITNVVGGNAPYEYSFDGGSTWGIASTALLPPGDYTVYVRDGACSYPMDVTVEGLPTPPNVTLTPEVSYNCDGTGTITASPSIAGYDYRYALDGIFNTPEDSNVFNNVGPGTYTVTTYYASQTPPTPSLLLTEDFGVGNGTIPSPDTIGYAYEDQTTSTAGGGDTNRNINDFQYSVTNHIVAPFGPWVNPNDHTNPSDPDGRFLVINVGTPSPGQIIYTKPINDVIPNRPLTISLYIFNLLNGLIGNTQLNPDLTIEIRTTGGVVVQSIRTGQIPKNTGPDDWELFSTNLDPGPNTSLEFVIRSEISGNSGNDLALDDIEIFQVPEVCELFVETPVTVEAGRVFGSTFLSSTNVSCNGVSDGTITFEVDNFDPVAGFEYSEDGGTTWITSTTSPVTTNAVFGAGSQTVLLRKADEITCTSSVTATITEPAALVATAIVNEQITCNAGATITANATGGTPTYVYQLEDDLGNVIAGYDFATNGNNRVFSNITLAGDYIVRVRDTNNCTDAIDTALTITEPETIAFDAIPTACYSGNNDGTIIVNVTDGNGGYQFRIDGGPWRTPTPVTATTFTFQSLASGSYDIEVRDQFGCPLASNTQTVVLNPSLNATVEVVNISSCADGGITVNAQGGDGDYSYAFMPTGSAPVFTDFGSSNTFAVTTGNDGDYDVYVRDNFAVAPDACNYMETVTVNPAVALAFTATPTDPECYEGPGSIEVDITSGIGPYTIQIIDLDNGGAADQTNTNVVNTTRTYFNLADGDYTIIVTDANNCAITETPVTINNPDELIAEISPILPPGCDPDPNLYGFEFINYTTTLGTLEFSSDGGATWGLSDTFVGASFASGTEVLPSVRVQGTNCQMDLPRYTIPYPLDDLDITIAAIVIDCNDLQVTVQGTAGLSPYEYTYSEDPVNFDPATATWTAATPGSHVFAGLVPGRTYVFYVRDSSGPPGCVRQSSVNVNNVAPPPIQIDGVATPTCDGLTNGQITYTVTENNPGELGGTFDWELFRVGSPAHTSIATGTVASFTTGDTFVAPTPASLGAGDYFVEIRGAAPNNCVIGSENVEVEVLDPITFTPNVLADITCADPGLIEIQSAQGGGGMYTYTLSSANFIAPIVTTNNPIEVPIANLVDPTATPFNVLVEIADQYSCPVTSLPTHTVSMNISQSPTITSVTTTNCGTPFSITVNASGGLAPYLYSINGGTTYVNNGGVFNNVPVGSYAISIIDANGCTASDTAEIYPTLQASAVQTKFLDCTVSPNAEITISASNGSGSYDYQISGPVNQVRTALPSPANSIVWDMASAAGIYTVEVFDNNRPTCPARSFIIDVPAAIVPTIDTINTTDVTCNGASDGTISVTVLDNATGPYTFEITSLDGSPISIAPTSTSNISATFTGLAPTTTPAGYIVTITGNAATNNCSVDSSSITIAEPSPVVVTMDATVEFACTMGNNGNNASISVQSVTGGSNTFVRYQFINDLNPGIPVQDGTNTTYIETNPNGGNYTVNVFDDLGCIGTATASIAPFVQISDPVVTDTADVTCNPGNDAQIEVGVTVNPGTATPNLEYVVNGINVVYNQSVSSTNHSETFNGLAAGNYSISITNLDTGCMINTVHTVETPPEMDVVATKLTDEECLNNGVDDGSFGVAISDYVGNYSYQVFDVNNNPIAGQNGTGNTATALPPITNLPGGTYYVRITQTEAPFCVENSNVITVRAPQAAITAVITQQTSVSCSNDQGSLLVNPSGGQGPYTITLTNTVTGQAPYIQTNVNAFIFTGLSAGDFDILVTDAYGCDFTDSITLIRPDDILATLSASTLVCYGDNNASVTASVGPRNVTPLYQYQLNVYDNMVSTTPLQTSVRQSLNTFDGLSAGFYSVTVTDDEGCATETNRIQITDPAEVSAQLIRTSELTCQTGAELELRAVGGTGPYTYSEDGVNFFPMNAANGPNTHLFTGLSAGTYRYYVQDSFNCQSILSNEIVEDPIEPLTLDVDTSGAFINCTGENTAIIFADADGGLGDYEYSLYTDASLSVGSRVAGPNSDGIFRNLTAGVYFVEAVSGDCTTTPVRVPIIEPDPLAISDSFTNVTCAGENDGSITVTLSGGAGGYQYAISPNLNQFDTENTFTDLAPGDYVVIAQDQNGCFERLEYTIIEPAVIMVVPTALPEVCVGSADGSITLDITGGTAPYSTALNSNNDADFVQDRLAFNGLSGGNYLVFVRDANGCETNLVVDIDPGVNLNATIEPVYECSGDTPDNYVNITLEDQTVIGDVLYALDSMDPADMQLNPDFRNTAPGLHYIAIAHSNGCVQTFDFTIEAFEPLTLTLEQRNLNEITALAEGGREGYTFYFDGRDNGDDNTFYITRTDTYEVIVIDENGCEMAANISMEFIDVDIPNFFTPDGDGKNDFWIPKNIQQFPDILIKIYDRYGRVVSRQAYDAQGWDGKYEGNELPTGDYWYVIQLNGEEDSREFVGHFTLYR